MFVCADSSNSEIKLLATFGVLAICHCNFWFWNTKVPTCFFLACIPGLEMQLRVRMKRDWVRRSPVFDCMTEFMKRIQRVYSYVNDTLGTYIYITLIINYYGKKEREKKKTRYTNLTFHCLRLMNVIYCWVRRSSNNIALGWIRSLELGKCLKKKKKENWYQ